MEFIEETLWALCFISSSQQFYKMIYYSYLTNEEIEALRLAGIWNQARFIPNTIIFYVY